MQICETVLPEFDFEMSLTRKTLERAPSEKFSWKPHAKSMSMGELASHLVSIAEWAQPTLSQDELVLDPAAVKQVAFGSKDEVLANFDNAVAKARPGIQSTPDADWYKPWSLKVGAHTVFTMPRIAVFRGFIVKHTVHHRAQLALYLRLNDLPVPAIYGPSADEQS
jgi:uncharacterized damage-inducible protein DinB